MSAIKSKTDALLQKTALEKHLEVMIILQIFLRKSWNSDPNINFIDFRKKRM